MTNKVLPFRRQPDSLSHNGRPPLSNDYADRLQRIKESLEKINKIMLEIKLSPPPKVFPKSSEE